MIGNPPEEHKTTREIEEPIIFENLISEIKETIYEAEEISDRVDVLLARIREAKLNDEEKTGLFKNPKEVQETVTSGHNSI